MQFCYLRSLIKSLGLSIVLAMVGMGSVFAEDPDHREFEATLHVPFRGEAVSSAHTMGSSEARVFTLSFEYPTVERTQVVAWRLELVDLDGKILNRWHGTENLLAHAVTVQVPWSGLINGAALPAGQYRVRMLANANDATAIANKLGNQRAIEFSGRQNSVNRGAMVDDILSDADNTEVVDQTWSIRVGNPAMPAMPEFVALPTLRNTSAEMNNLSSANSTKRVEKAQLQSQAATSALPYTVYYGNLHSQTNHSDGGGNVSSCTGAQAPQAGPFGPSDAYLFASNQGLDFLMTSEHNHLFDGSTSTNASANPVAVKALYQSGITAMNNFNGANPNFLALYGMEWGVISNGGHLNIFNSDELLGWESNSSGQLLADTLTPKGDYAGLYTLMNQRGLVGQFNHPATTAQFNANGVDLGYTADGDAVMALCEVLNTSAFSSNTTETETSRSTYESACQKFLEAGYHVAFTTDQDNHCANWGASYTNRTGVLLANGTTLNRTNFVNALKARRVFASMDKNSQLILTANGRLMGERFSNAGPVTLVTNFANSAGRTVASVQVLEGVPGRNGTVTTLSNTASTTITPSIGEHFYYAKVTQDDGKILWSAPVWITQSNGTGDTTPPSVSASEAGSSGTITLSASASDNVGVTNVEFYVDGTLKGSKATSPYSITLDSTTLTNSAHSLIAKAFDAANNSASSAAVSFSVSNVVSDTTPPTVSASEAGSSGIVTLSASASDNVGVTNVEFYVDGALKGSKATAPYSITLDSTTLTNGTHSLVAKAFDAANNSASSAAISFSVSNIIVTSKELMVNGGFESGTTGWTGTTGDIGTFTGEAAFQGTKNAWMGGNGSAITETLAQTITIPAASTSAILSFYLHIDTAESGSTVYDKLQVQVRNTSGTVLKTLATYSNVNAATGYQQRTFDLTAYKGQTVQIYFTETEDASLQTSFVLDNVSLISK